MDEDEMFQKVRSLLQENMVTGYSKTARQRYHYTKPSPETYPFQFFWDTCLHVFILVSLGDIDMAKKHLSGLFSLQEEDGFVGHMIYWNNILPGRFTDIFQSRPDLKSRLLKTHMSALLQPPLVARAVQRIWTASGDREFLIEMLPKLKKYYNYLAENRDFEGDGLLSIISPFESGIDWKPSFDEVVGFSSGKADWRLFIKVIGVDIRNFLNNYDLKKIHAKNYFIVKEVGFNTIYAQNLKAMAQMCHEVDDPEGEVYQKRAKKCLASIVEIMYDESSAAFFDVYGKDNKMAKVLTPTIFFPLVLGELPATMEKNILERHFFNGEEFKVPFPIPSVAVDHPSFDARESLYIWRGPTWILFNWFLYPFFLENGHEKVAAELAESIKKLIAKSGFREYYHPFEGDGYGAKDFTWAGLILDMEQTKKRWNDEKNK